MDISEEKFRNLIVKSVDVESNTQLTKGIFVAKRKDF